LTIEKALPGFAFFMGALPLATAIEIVNHAVTACCD